MLHIKRAPYEGFLRKTGAILDQMPDRILPVLHILVDDRFIPVLVKEMQRYGGNPPFLPSMISVISFQRIMRSSPRHGTPDSPRRFRTQKPSLSQKMA